MGDYILNCVFSGEASQEKIVICFYYRYRDRCNDVLIIYIKQKLYISGIVSSGLLLIYLSSKLYRVNIGISISIDVEICWFRDKDCPSSYRRDGEGIGALFISISSTSIPIQNRRTRVAQEVLIDEDKIIGSSNSIHGNS